MPPQTICAGEDIAYEVAGGVKKRQPAPGDHILTNLPEQIGALALTSNAKRILAVSSSDEGNLDRSAIEPPAEETFVTTY